MILNEHGKINDDIWNEMPQHYPGAVLYHYIVMPNHFHGVVEIELMMMSVGRRFIASMMTTIFKTNAFRLMNGTR